MNPKPSPSFYRFVIVLVIAALALAACSPAMATPSYSRDSNTSPQEAAPGEPRAAVDAEIMAGAGALESQAQMSERIVIKNATMTLVVDDPQKSALSISWMAEAMGGYVVTSNVYKATLSSGKDVMRGTITVRVPAARLNEALETIRAESKEPPVNENQESQDVTSEYTDLQSRLRNLESTEAKLVEIMEQAKGTKEVLQVYGDVTQVREQIETVKGRILYYEQSGALSSIQVELVPVETEPEPLIMAVWDPAGVARDATAALVNFLQGLATIVLWLVIFVLPIVAVAYIGFFLPVKWIQQFIRRRQPQAAPPAPPVQE